VRIYNDKEVDELIFLDITASVDGNEPQLDLLYEIATECFMPFTYGGGVRTIDQMSALFQLGAEKVALCHAAYQDPVLVERAAARFGNQAVVVAIDVKKKRFFGKGYSVQTLGGRHDTKQDPVRYAKRMESLGAGEILLTSIDRDGTMTGYDCELIAQVASAVSIPVIACGGAGVIEDFGRAVAAGASAVATGSMVVYQGKNRAVLINFPSRKELGVVLR
jgi:cyclase